MVAEVQTMRFHGPGWTLELEDRSYWVWAPQDGKIADPHEFADVQRKHNPGWEPREHWAACWQGDDGLDGGFVKGASVEEVVAIFPDPDVAARFCKVIEEVISDG